MKSRKPNSKTAEANARLGRKLVEMINSGRFPWGSLTLRVEQSRIFHVRLDSSHRVESDGEMEWTPETIGMMKTSTEK